MPNTKKISLKTDKNKKYSEIYHEFIGEIPATSNMHQTPHENIKANNISSKSRNTVKSNQPKKNFNSSSILPSNARNLVFPSSMYGNNFKGQLQGINMGVASNVNQRKNVIDDVRKSIVVRKKDIRRSTNGYGRQSTNFSSTGLY